MASSKFSKVYMLDVRANKTQKEKIEFLVNNLVEMIKTIFPTAKVEKIVMDREE